MTRVLAHEGGEGIASCRVGGVVWDPGERDPLDVRIHLAGECHKVVRAAAHVGQDWQVLLRPGNGPNGASKTYLDKSLRNIYF